MADVITRFKLETTQYDSKLREASKKLSDFTKEATTYGNEFSKFTQKNIEAARAFGQVATSATNSKDKVKELVGAFNDVAKSYNALTKEQQQSDFGKALAESMTQLQGRIKEAKAEMNDTGGILGQLKDKFVVNIDALKLFQMGLSAAKAALDVAKDAFFANEQSLDEWGRIVESSESLYKGFLDALNTGDISGYLQRIDEITKAARDAYNALDELNTFNAFNQINVEKTRTGMTESIVDYREGNSTKDMVKAAGEAYKKELEERKKLEKEAYLKKVAEIAAQRGVSAEDLTTALSGKYGSYKALKEMPLSGTRTVFYGGGMFGGGGSYEQAVPGSVQEKLGDALRRLNDDELKNLQALGAQAERTGNEIAQVDRQLVRVLNGRQGGSGGGGGRTGGNTKNGPTYEVGSLAEAQAEVQRLAKLWNEAGADVRDQYLQPLIEAEAKVKSMQNVMNLQKEQAQGKLQGGHIMKTNLGQDTFAFDKTLLNNREKFLDELNKYFKDHPIVIPMDTSNNDVKKIQETARKTAAVVGTIGQAFNQIENPAAKVAGTVAQAIANVAMAYSQTLAEDKTTKENIWAFIAAAAASTISMVQTISSIHSATGYKNGGVVKGYASGGMADGMGGGMITGTTYSNDQIPIMANAGEVILNKAQQASVAGQLQGSGLRGMSLKTKVKGTELLVWLDNSLAQSGRGELMTWGQ